MKKNEFIIGQSFWLTGLEWKCTDIGTRTICAIQLDKNDPSWYNGPPYAVAECVIDEYDQEVCFRTKEEYEQSMTTIH